MGWPFRKKAPVLDPMTRLKLAVDEVNAAAALLPPDQHHIRPWVQAGDRVKRTKPRLMLAYWDNEERAFVVTHGDY